MRQNAPHAFSHNVNVRRHTVCCRLRIRKPLLARHKSFQFSVTYRIITVKFTCQYSPVGCFSMPLSSPVLRPVHRHSVPQSKVRKSPKFYPLPKFKVPKISLRRFRLLLLGANVIFFKQECSQWCCFYYLISLYFITKLHI